MKLQRSARNLSVHHESGNRTTLSREGRGGHFDPDAVDRPLDMEGSISALADTYRDPNEEGKTS